MIVGQLGGNVGGGMTCGDGQVTQRTQGAQSLATEPKSLDPNHITEILNLGGVVL